MKDLYMLIRYACLVLVLLVNSSCTFSGAEPKISDVKDEYSCSPCGQDCDKEVYNGSGTCSHCGMPLVKKSTIQFETIQPSEVCDYISKNPGVIILDVRTRDEFEGKIQPELGKIRNAINIPIQELEANISTMAAYNGKKILVYCSRSHRSPRASYILAQNGFKDVTNMAGGMSVMRDERCKMTFKQ